MKDRYVNKKNSISDIWIAIVLSLAGTIGIGDTIAITDTIPYSNSFFSVVVFGGMLLLMVKALPEYRKASRYNKIVAVIFAFLLSSALHFGSRLETVENVNFKELGMYVSIALFTLFAAPVSEYFWNIFDNLMVEYYNNKADGKDKKDIKFLSIWLMIFLMWLPTFMAFFPGAFVYDATDEYIEVISRNFTMHHPLLHVLLLGGIVHGAEYIGWSANAGIAIYTIFQMAIFSAVLAFIVYKIQQWGAGKKIILGTTIFFGLFPLFPMYAVCSAKDTLFTAMFLMIVVLLVEFVRDDKAFFNKALGFLVVSVFMMLLRNNGMYAYMVAIPFIVIFAKCSGRNMKNVGKLVVLMLLSFLIYEGTNYCLKVAVSASDSEHQEMLTVPIQQLARVYKYSPETFSEEELDTLYEILPDNYLITYTPRCSDVLKSGFNNYAYSKNPGKYQKLWASIGMRKPYIYINAWLVNCYGYWYPDMIINVYGGNQMYTYQYKDSSYFGFETEPPGTRVSLFPLLEKLYRNISLELFQQKLPVISMLFAPGFVFWIFAWRMFGYVRRKKWMLLGVFMPVLLLWATVLLGPTVLVRYVLILWCVSPLLGVEDSVIKNVGNT